MFLADLLVVLLFTVGLEYSMSRLVVMLPLMARIGLPRPGPREVSTPDAGGA